MVKAL